MSWFISVKPVIHGKLRYTENLSKRYSNEIQLIILLILVKILLLLQLSFVSNTKLEVGSYI